MGNLLFSFQGSVKDFEDLEEKPTF
jgi:hypothetical protein